MASIYKIISEETLEKMVCSKCDNYLSYGQPKIGSASVICGRCNQEEAIIPFNESIKEYLFPCINRFDNCKQLLYHCEIENHEKVCKSPKHSCTECHYIGNGCQLYHHYIKKHPDNILKYPFFQIYLFDNKTFNYLYRKNNNLFIVTYKVTRCDDVLKISFRNVSNVEKIPQLCLIIRSFTKNTLFSKSQKTYLIHENCLKFDIFKIIEKCKENTVVCYLEVDVDNELFIFDKVATETNENSKMKELLQTLQSNLYPKLTCSNCKCYVIPPFHKCPYNHVICEECFSAFCNSCDDITNWSRALDLEAFHEFIPLPCRWNCGHLELSSQLRQHEKTCDRRRYKCVVEWCDWTGSLNDLIKHWHSSVLIHKESHLLYGYHEEMEEFYLIFDKEIFYFRMNPLRIYGRNFHVRKISNVSVKDQKYAVRITVTHTCDGNLREKTHYIKFGGITVLGRFYFDLYFGACKNYKIIFNISSVS